VTNSNPRAALAESMYGRSPAGIFGYSHMLGGHAGGQADTVHVPFADVGPFKIENGLRDERVLFLSDIFPTGYMAAKQADMLPVQPNDKSSGRICFPRETILPNPLMLLGRYSFKIVLRLESASCI